MQVCPILKWTILIEYCSAVILLNNGFVRKKAPRGCPLRRINVYRASVVDGGVLSDTPIAEV